MELQQENTEADERPTSRRPWKPFQRTRMVALPTRAKNVAVKERKKLPMVSVNPSIQLNFKPKKYILYGQLVTLFEVVISAIIKRWIGFQFAYSRGKGWTIPMDEAILYERLYCQVREAGLDNMFQQTEEWVDGEEANEEVAAKHHVDRRQPSDDDPEATSAPIVPVRPMRRPKPLKNPWEFTVNGQRTTGAELTVCSLIYNWDQLKRTTLTYWGLEEPLVRETFDLGEITFLHTTLDTIRQDPKYENVDTLAQAWPLEDTLSMLSLPLPKLDTTVSMHVNRCMYDETEMG